MSAAQIGKPATKRHWELELLRIFSMFLIVATHYFASDDSPSRIDPALAQSWKSALHAVTIMPGQVGVRFSFSSQPTFYRVVHAARSHE